MRRAYCALKTRPHYRHEAFHAGLQAAGFHVETRLPSAPPAPGDILVIWNRYSCDEQTADKWEAQGGTVLVAENGYIGQDGAGQQYYALARHGHNGSGSWFCGGPERWDRLGIELKPWRERGEHVLVCPNRSFGPKGFAMPYGWDKSIIDELRRVTRRPIRLRPHPQNSTPARPLAEDLNNAWAVVIWASSAGVHALVAGVPVISLAPYWICRTAALDDLRGIEGILGGELRAAASTLRLLNMQRLAWAQWTIEEIAAGEPFGYLLPDTRQAESLAAV